MELFIILSLAVMYVCVSFKATSLCPYNYIATGFSKHSRHRFLQTPSRSLVILEPWSWSWCYCIKKRFLIEFGAVPPPLSSLSRYHSHDILGIHTYFVVLIWTPLISHFPLPSSPLTFFACIQYTERKLYYYDEDVLNLHQHLNSLNQRNY